jgi:hypothetical protein
MIKQSYGCKDNYGETMMHSLYTSQFIGSSSAGKIYKHLSWALEVQVTLPIYVMIRKGCFLFSQNGRLVSRKQGCIVESMDKVFFY